MTTPLPLLLVTPNTGVASPPLAATVNGVAGSAVEGDAGAFASLMARQLAGVDAELPLGPPGIAESFGEIALPLVSNKPGTDLASLMSSLSNAAQTIDNKTQLLESTKLADATAATLAAAGEAAPVVVVTEPGVSEVAAVLVVNAPPEPVPDEAALIDAAGGKDESADAIDAALSAALDVGIVPTEGERLVQSAVLPVAVRSASSVQVLDQLLGSLLSSGSGEKPGQPTATAPELAALGRKAVPSPDLRATVAQDSATQFQNSPAGPKAADATIASLGPDALPTQAPSQSLVTSSETAALDAWPQGLAAPSRNAGLVAGPVAQTYQMVDPTGRPAIDSGLITPSTGLIAEQARASISSEQLTSNEMASVDAPKAQPQAPLVERIREQLGLAADQSVRFTVESSTPVDPSAALKTPGAVPPALASLAGGQMAAASPGTTDSSPAVSSGASTLPQTGGGLIAAGMGTLMSDGGASDFLMSGQGFGATDADAAFGFGQESVESAGGFNSLLAFASNNAAPAKVSAAVPTHAQPPMVPPDQVAVHIAAAARDGARNLSIQLRPAALGRIEVELSVGRDGTVKARVQAERSETLDLLQRDARGLERALEAAGLKAEAGGLSFSLKDGGRQDRQPMPSHSPSGLTLADLPSEPAIATRHAYRGMRADGRALDIEV